MKNLSEEKKEMYLEQENIKYFKSTYDFFNNQEFERNCTDIRYLINDLDYMEIDDTSNEDIKDLIIKSKEQLEQVLESFTLLRYLLEKNYDKFEDYEPVNVELPQLEKIARKEENYHIIKLIEKYFND